MATDQEQHDRTSGAIESARRILPRVVFTAVLEGGAALLIWMLYVLAERGDHPYYAGILTGVPLYIAYNTGAQFVRFAASAIREEFHPAYIAAHHAWLANRNATR
jgi:hypothetical protein